MITFFYPVKKSLKMEHGICIDLDKNNGTSGFKIDGEINHKVNKKM